MSKAGAEELVVSQKDLEFSPNEITVSVGDTVIFTNDDRTRHHIQSRSGPEDFESRLLPPRANYEVQLNEDGVWEVGCRIHPRMRMTITAQR
jgi:plastocyanin